MRNIQKALLPIITRVILALYILLLFSGTASNAQEAAKPVKIGVLAKRGAQRCLEKWGSTAEYLTQEIPGHSFTIVPLDYDEIYSAVEQEEVDFIVANPYFYVGLELIHGASRIATLKNLRLGIVSTVFGGVIFCKAEHKGLKNLNDLRGKTFMAVKETSFGGWLMAWRELKGHGIDPYRDFADLNFGGTHDAVIYAVLNGEVDAGAVRTDALERMAMEGKINLDDFYIFHDHECPHATLPFLRSTHLYPEWPFAKAEHTSDELAERVAVALLKMSPDRPAAKAAKSAGWTIPLNYQPVHDCLKYLRITPYEGYGKVALRDVIRQYLPWFSGAFVAMAMIILFALYAACLNRKLLHAMEGQKKELIERKRAKDKYKILMETVDAGLDLIDQEGNILLMNKRAALRWGLDPIEIIGKNIRHVFPPGEFIDTCFKVIEKVKKTGEGFQQEQYVEPLGKWFLESIQPVKHETGEFYAIQVLTYDITERKQAEKEQDIRNKVLRAFLMESNDDMYDAVLKIVLDAFESEFGVFGYINEKGDLVCPSMTKHVWDQCRMPDKRIVFPPDTWGDSIWGNGLRTGKSDYSNEPFQVPQSHVPINNCLTAPLVLRGKSIGLLTVANKTDGYDKSDKQLLEIIANNVAPVLQARLTHKQAEEKIREKEENYRELADSIGDVFFAMDGDLRYTYWNKASEGLTGISANHAIGKTIFEIFPDNEDTRKAVSFYQEVLKTQQSQNFINEYNLGGKAYFFEISAYPSKDGVSVFVKDITPQKKAEEALKKSERRYHELFNSVMEGIAIIDEDEIIKFCNPAYAGIFEADSAKALEGKCVLEYIPEHQKELVLSQTEIRKKGLSSQYELEIVTAKGNNRVGLVSASPRYDDNGNFIGSFVAIIDITETKQLQESAERAKRLETAGRIAGQVAHDFNNLLGPLVAYPDFIKNELPEGHLIIPLLNDMEHAALHMAEINQQLLALGRRGHYSQVPLNLNEIILQVTYQMKPLPNELIIETNLYNNLMNIKAGPAQIHRVILNLLDNAKDAMRNIGRLTIKTENYYVDAVAGKYERIPKGEYVKLTISDNGCGISDESLSKIFDPFFTTKTTDKKRGSGLGLSVVDAVVKDHSGYIDFESTIGKGTSFYLYFPITRETVEDSISGEITGGTESILVIDDDKTQRDVTLKLLKNLGYESDAVESGEEAIELLKKSPYDLLLLDMVMPPGIDGAETYKRALAMNPSQKAVIVSGYSETERVEEALKLGAGAYIRKPLTLKAIAAAIRKELDRVAV